MNDVAGADANDGNVDGVDDVRGDFGRCGFDEDHDASGIGEGARHPANPRPISIALDGGRTFSWRAQLLQLEIVRAQRATVDGKCGTGRGR